MHSITSRVAKRCWNIFALVLAVAGVGGIWGSKLAQLNSKDDAPFAIPRSSLPAPSLVRASVAASKSFEDKSATGLSGLPRNAQGPISAALGQDDSRYWFRRSADVWRGENLRQALVAEFTPSGAEIRTYNLHWGVQTFGYGYGEALHRVKEVAPDAKNNRVEFRRDAVKEWYENGPLGLEQGFTLAYRPGKANGRPLTVALTLRGNLVAALEPGGKALELKQKDGKAALRYTGLQARDATGRELRSWLEVQGERLLLRVEDEGARYPLVVDPWIQQAELTASDGQAQDGFGGSVAVSGNTVVVGAPYRTVGSNHYGQGAAYVFVQNGDTWSQQAELTSSDGAAYDAFGFSVAISGSTIAVGAPARMVGSNQRQGASYVFVGNGGTWSQQAELTASDGATQDLFGWAVAVEGNTAVVGAYAKTVNFHYQQGAAYVFVESGGSWSQQAELTASDGLYTDEFGYSVALNGSTVVAGAPGHTVGSNQYQGAAYVFVENGGTWTQQVELTASDGEGGDGFGDSVAIGGSTTVVGAPCHPRAGAPFCQSGPGAAYVFVGNGGTWTQQAELTASDGGAGDGFGGSLAVSGSTIVMGSRDHTVGSNQGQGAAYVFDESGGSWSQEAELTASDGVAWDYLGSFVAISGSTAVAGAPGHTAFGYDVPGPGAAYVFGPVSSPPAVTLSPSSLSFGKQIIVTTSAAKTVTVTNTGNATLNITSIAASVNFAVSSTSCGTTLPAGMKCQVKVTFTPTQPGLVTGTLMFTDNAPDSPQTVGLSGRGVLPAALTPTSATYAKQTVGTTSTPKTFALTNNQTVTLTGIAISTTGDFAVSATTCGTTLAAKKKCTISVTFTPAQKGKRYGQLNVGDSALYSPQVTGLIGTGN